MKKALIVANLFGFVGFLLNDIRLLQLQGYEVVFAAKENVSADDSVRKELESNGVRFFPLDISTKNPLARQNLTAYMEIKKLLAEEKFDLLHCHTPIAGFIARLAAKGWRKRGMRVIYTTHGFAFCRYSTKKQWLIYFWLEKIASLFTDTIITINKEDYHSAKRLYCKDVRRISGVGVDTSHYHDIDIDVDAYKKKLGLPTDKIMILSVGELSARKNHQIIIKALGSLQNKSQYVFVICGREVEGSGFAANLQHLADECGVELHLLGHRSDIPEIMHCSDIGAIPSVREGLGLAGVQSLCAEVPLIGTNVQGIKEYILDGISGYLCEPYDVRGYAEAIVKLSNSEHRKSMKKNCYGIAKQFDVSVSYQQMKGIYISLLGERG